MNADVESVRKPVRLICIFLGSGVCINGINTVSERNVEEILFTGWD